LGVSGVSGLEKMFLYFGKKKKRKKKEWMGRDNGIKRVGK
jgi:hypothetical protein